MILRRLHSNFIQLQKLQKLSVVLLAVYCLSLLLFVIIDTSTSSNIVDAKSNFSKLDKSQGVYLENFFRVEYKNNVKKWTILAESGKYSETQGNAYIKSPLINIYEDNEVKPSVITSDSARLVAVEGKIKTAFLDGNVKLTNAQGVNVESSSAEYDSQESLVTFPNHAVIKGQGYSVEGDYLVVQPDNNIIDFMKNVDSRFESGLKAKAFTDLKTIKTL